MKVHWTADAPLTGWPAASGEMHIMPDYAALLERGWSYNRIARKYGMSSGAVRNWCLKHGLKSKHKPIVRRRKKSIA